MQRSFGLNLFASWMGHATAIVVGVFLMPYVLHMLGDSEYGSWIFVSSIASYAGLLYLGFGQTLSRFVATHAARHDWDKLNQSVSVVFSAYSVMGCLALTFAGLLAWWAPALNQWDAAHLREVRIVILMLGLNTGCGMIGSTFGGVLIGLQRFDVVKGVCAVGDLLRLTIVLSCLRPQWGLATLAGAFLATTLLECLLYAVFAFRCLPALALRPRCLTRAAIRESFGFSLKAFVGIIAGQLIAATDLIIIGQFLGKTAIVPYYIALRLCQFLQKPIQQIGDVSLPRAGELASDDQHPAIQRLVSRTLGLSFLLIAGLYVGAAYFGDALIAAWMGPNYAGSHAILLILMGAQLVTLPANVLRQILFGAGHVRTPSLLLLAAAVVNLACSITLIQWWGLIGVAVGTTVPLVLIELCLLWPYAVRQVGLDVRRTLSEAIGPAILPLVALWAFCFSVDTWIPLSRWERLVTSLLEVPRETAVARWTYVLGVTGLGGGLFLSLRFGPSALRTRWRDLAAPNRPAAAPEPVELPEPQLERTCV